MQGTLATAQNSVEEPDMDEPLEDSEVDSAGSEEENPCLADKYDSDGYMTCPGECFSTHISSLM